MDGKWNWAIDNFAIRVTINTLGFVLWLALSVGILEAAIRL